jgi:DNA-directed RNA polymerase specialized sigma subunit
MDQSDAERALSAERARDSLSMSSDDEVMELPADVKGLTGSEDRVLLAASVRALDERERRIVFLRFHADMTERQIAREIGLSQGSRVAPARYRAREAAKRAGGRRRG